MLTPYAFHLFFVNFVAGIFYCHLIRISLSSKQGSSTIKLRVCLRFDAPLSHVWKSFEALPESLWWFCLYAEEATETATARSTPLTGKSSRLSIGFRFSACVYLHVLKQLEYQLFGVREVHTTRMTGSFSWPHIVQTYRVGSANFSWRKVWSIRMTTPQTLKMLQVHSNWMCTGISFFISKTVREIRAIFLSMAKIQLKRVNHKLSRWRIDVPSTWRFREASNGPEKSLLQHGLVEKRQTSWILESFC